MMKDGSMLLVIGFIGKRVATVEDAHINIFNQIAE